MRQSNIKITTKSGECVEGIANTITLTDQQEQLVLASGMQIELTEIAILEALNNVEPSHNFKITL